MFPQGLYTEYNKSVQVRVLHGCCEMIYYVHSVLISVILNKKKTALQGCQQAERRGKNYKSIGISARTNIYRVILAKLQQHALATQSVSIVIIDQRFSIQGQRVLFFFLKHIMFQSLYNSNHHFNME